MQTRLSSVAGTPRACPTDLLALCSRELTVILLVFGIYTPVFKAVQPGQCELD